MVYDKQNRLILSQDAALRTTSNTFSAKGWMFTKYDRFGRVVYTGFFSNTGSRTAMQTAVNSMAANSGNNEEKSTAAITQNGMDIYYTKNAFPTGSMIILSVSYYDTYPAYSFNPAFPSAIFGKSVLTDQPSAQVSTRTLPVMTLIKNIEDHYWTKNYVYYDTQARAIGSHSINYLGGYTRTESDLDFAGVPLQTKTFHKRLTSDAEKIITQTFTYDHQNRLLVHKHKINNNPEEILTQNDYDELSQLRSKKVGGTVLGSGLQTVDYTYNIRGWMTRINDPSNLGNDLFGYRIRYHERAGLETPDAMDGTLKVLPKFNGNIAEVDWRTSTQENDPLKRYGYVYDTLNRLTAGFYQKEGTEPSKEYFEKTEYDLNGNITRLKRSEGIQGGGTTSLVVDNLRYDYTGNRLNQIADEQQNPSGYPYFSTPNVIEYDNGLANGNGNMTKHLDKGISSIEYNYLNLPNQITQNAQLTQHVYRADGVKVKKLFGNTETGYLDGFQYKSTVPSEENPGGLGTPDEVAVIKLRIIPTSEGYFDVVSNQYVYNYTDHLGNVRLSYSDTNSDGIIQPRQYQSLICNYSPSGNFCYQGWKPGEIVELNNYYPFGLMHNYTATTKNAYQYKYNGKELLENGMYDYGARFYMPDIGRWGVADPLAEVTPHLSSYHYGNNNPVRFTDPDGRQSWDNLTTYNPGSAVSSFMHRNGFGEEYMPLVFRDDAGMMMTSALGNDGQGGGGGLTATNGGIRSLRNYFNKNGINSNSIDYLFDNFKRGTVIWWTDSDAQYGDFNALQLSRDTNWYGPGGRANWGFASAAASAEHLSGISRIGSNWKIYQATQTGRVFYGNQYVKTLGINKIGNIAGKASFGIGMAMDTYGIVEWSKNRNSPNAVHPAKAGLNTTMGAIGVWGGPPGAIASGFYFGIDAFYPGGWAGAVNDQDRLYQENKAINPNWQMFPGAMKQ